jgi:hypothetical protein
MVGSHWPWIASLVLLCLFSSFSELGILVECHKRVPVLLLYVSWARLYGGLQVEERPKPRGLEG